MYYCDITGIHAAVGSHQCISGGCMQVDALGQYINQNSSASVYIEESKCTFDLAVHYQFCNYKCPETCFQPIAPNDPSLQIECGMKS